MELKQPAESDNKRTHPESLKKHKSNRKPARPASHRLSSEKSLRDDWERTLKNKGHHAKSFEFDNDEEIDFHRSINQSAKTEVVEKDDPIWEPWQEKEPPRQSLAQVVEQPHYQENITEPITVDPSLSDEARRHAEAVDSIARTHAESSTPLSYKDSLPKEAQEIIERLQPAAGHHIEQSVWHNIEVDNSGKAVEHPNFDYGEAYRGEIRAESDNFQTEDPETVAAASGQLAVSSPTSSSDAESSSVLVDNRTPDRYTVPMDQYDSLPAGQTNVEPVLWVILTVIIMAIILALVI